MSKPVPNFAWSLTANYPAGGNLWNGQPVALMPPGTFFTPSLPIDAEELNWLFGTVSKQMQANSDWSGSNPALNWYPIIETNPLTCASCAWDPLKSRWLIAELTGPGVSVSWTYGMDQGYLPLHGNNFNVLGSTITPASGTPNLAVVLADQNTAGAAWVVIATTTSLEVHYWSGSAWSTVRTVTAVVSDVQAAWLAGRFVYSHADTAAAVSSTANNGVAWSDRLTGNNNWSVKSNGTMAILMPVNLAQGTFYYYTSTDGVNWPITTLPALNGGVATATGLTWTADANGPCWLLYVQTTPSTQTVYRSSDGFNWTVQATMPANLDLVTEMTAVGSLVVAQMGDHVAGGPSQQVWSPNGGVNWFTGTAWFPANQNGGTGYSKPRIVSSPMGFLAWNTYSFRFSHIGGGAVQLV